MCKMKFIASEALSKYDPIILYIQAMPRNLKDPELAAAASSGFRLVSSPWLWWRISRRELAGRSLSKAAPLSSLGLRTFIDLYVDVHLSRSYVVKLLNTKLIKRCKDGMLPSTLTRIFNSHSGTSRGFPFVNLFIWKPFLKNEFCLLFLVNFIGPYQILFGCPFKGILGHLPELRACSWEYLSMWELYP